MDRKLFFGILAFSLVAIVLAIVLPGGKQVDNQPKLPWQINQDASGNLQVFDITLDQTTLAEARKVFQEQGETTLFRSASGDISLESYFQRLFLSGIRADLVLKLAVDPELAQAMFERGTRISKLGSGGRKVTLAETDMELLANQTISHLTYIPAADLDAELIRSRFGDPDTIIKEPDSQIEHWLYPDKGLDIALNPEGKEILQYISPAKFDLLVQPLQRK